VLSYALRQAQGFIENILMKLGMHNLQCPDYTLLSKRLKHLNLTAPVQIQSNINKKDRGGNPQRPISDSNI